MALIPITLTQSVFAEYYDQLLALRPSIAHIEITPKANGLLDVVITVPFEGALNLYELLEHIAGSSAA